ncbi:CxC2 domain-containing protein [Favolaschia claudopus]|uniref:CxC2 domain-containing protein n=1 Tax=Favolaschia claudopus TaxID=2862362 RepID=A0AAW0DND7_9AGAR
MGWEEWVARWESKQHTTAEDSPFETKDEEKTLRDIQLQIATEEFMSTGGGAEVEREHTPGSFVSTGLGIEEVQRKLTVDVHAAKDPTPTQKLDFTKRCTVLRRRIKKFREIQRIYMPSVRGVLSDGQRASFDGIADELPEATWLFMPSEIEDKRLRAGACAVGLPEIEGRMREGEAIEALEGVRKGLRTRTMTNRYKLRHYTGQALLTRGQGILRQINVRIHSAKLRYRYARVAHLALRGHGAWEEKLRVLADDDVRALNERALTAEEKAQNEHWAEIGGAIIEGGIERAAGVARGEGSHTLSWIWYTTSAGEVETDDRLEEALRVEWCKARARSGKWDSLAAGEWPGATEELTEGRRAYAAEQAATECARCADLEKRWRPILAKADAYLRSGGAAEASVDGIVLVDVNLGDELGVEEEEARLEGVEDEGDDV